MATKQHIWLKKALAELLPDEIPEILVTDNTGPIDISKNPRINNRSKHIDIQFHYMHENVLNRTITFSYCSSAENLADICTNGINNGVLDHLIPQDNRSQVRRGVGIW